MKHLAVLRGRDWCRLARTVAAFVNSLNVVPIRLIYERWVSEYQDLGGAS